MSFKFACARPLYKQRVHPRLLAGPAELDAIRVRVRSGIGKRLLAAMKKRLLPMVRRINDAADDEGAMAVVGGAYFARQIWHCLDEIAAFGKIARRPDAIAAVRRVLLAIASAGNAGSAVHNGVGALSQVALSYDLIHEDLSAADRKAIAHWMLERGVRGGLKEVRKGYFRSAGINARLVAVISALFYVLVIEGEEGIPDLTSERAELLLMFEASLNATHGVNGYPIEDIGYGTGISAYLAHIVEAAHRSGYFNPYEKCPRITRFGQAILHFVQPWGGHLTSTGDHYDIFVERSFVLGRLAQVTRDPALAWLVQTLQSEKDALIPTDVVTAGKLCLPASWLTLLVLDSVSRPVHPRRSVPTAFVDRTRGIVSFRSSWNDDATYVTFDGSQRSPSVAGHDQASAGHFCLSALGEYFAIDTGRYNMEQNCHNVVLVDGVSGRSTHGDWRHVNEAGHLTDYRPAPNVDTASIDSSHQHNCFWARRTLGLVKCTGATPYVWIIDDLNKANDYADFVWQLHTSPENTIKLAEQSATIRGWRKGNLLDIHFVMPPPDTFPRPHTLSLAQDIAICSSTNYIPNSHQRAKAFKRPSDMLHASVFERPRLLAKISGYNGRFMSLLLPRAKGQLPASVTPLATLDNSLAVRITFPQVEDVLVWSFEHGLLEVPGAAVSVRGNWCLQRRSRATGRLLSQTVGGYPGEPAEPGRQRG